LKQTRYPINSKEEVFDCLCIGTSLIISLEAIHQKKLGKDVLMVDSSDSFGGAWKTIEIDGIKDVENAIHYFTPNEKGISFLKRKLKWPIEKSKGKFQYFRIFGNFYIRFLYDSLTSRLISATFFSDRPKGFISAIKYFFRSIYKAIKEPRKISYYTAEGSSGITNNLQKLLKKHQVEIKFNSKIERIYFDLEKKIVCCQIDNKKKVFCKSLILGHGARLPKIDINNGSLVLEEKFNPRPAYHLIVEDDKVTDSFEVIFVNDTLIKYVHDVTRFSSLKDKTKDKRKVFVFALHSYVTDHSLLSDELFQKLKHIRLVGENAKVIKSLFSEVILPTLYDEDLYFLKEAVGNLVSIFRTENLTNGISYYSKRWKLES
jgi:hypothetical protein